MQEKRDQKVIYYLCFVLDRIESGNECHIRSKEYVQRKNLFQITSKIGLHEEINLRSSIIDLKSAAKIN